MTTTKTTHTPGPWLIYKRYDHPDIQIERVVPGSKKSGAFNQGICDMGQFECRARPGEAMANARLIARAPDLLDLLREWAEFAGDDCQCPESAREPEALAMANRCAPCRTRDLLARIDGGTT